MHTHFSITQTPLDSFDSHYDPSSTVRDQRESTFDGLPCLALPQAFTAPTAKQPHTCDACRIRNRHTNPFFPSSTQPANRENPRGGANDASSPRLQYITPHTVAVNSNKTLHRLGPSARSPGAAAAPRRSFPGHVSSGPKR